MRSFGRAATVNQEGARAEQCQPDIRDRSAHREEGIRKMMGSGCARCPAAEECTTVRYRGSACAANRDKYELGDPKTFYDQVIGMRPEELAESPVIRPPYCEDTLKKRCSEYGGDCSQCKLNWLLTPVNEQQ